MDLIQPPDYQGYEQILRSFPFINTISLKIPDEVRNFAYSISVDVIIESTANDHRFDYRQLPPNSLYGFLTVVTEDCALEPIEIVQPRQRVFFERIEHAYTSWYGLYKLLFQYTESINEANTITIPTAIAVGAEIEPRESTCPIPEYWLPTKLREIYFKSIYRRVVGRIEVSWDQPIPFDWGQCSYNGSNRRTQDEKEDGLPENPLPREDNNPNSSDPRFNWGTSNPSWLNSKGSGFNERNPPLNPYNTSEDKFYQIEVRFVSEAIDNNGSVLGTNLANGFFPRVQGRLTGVAASRDINSLTTSRDFIAIGFVDIAVFSTVSGQINGVVANTNVFSPFTAFPNARYRLLSIQDVIVTEVP